MPLFKTTPKKVARWEQRLKKNKILKALDHKDTEVCLRALEVVKNLKIEKALPRLKELINYHYARKAGLEALGAINTTEAAHIIASYHAGGKEARTDVLKVLFEMKHPLTIPTVIKYIQEDTHDEIFETAKKVLCSIDHPDVVTLLLEVYRRKDHGLRVRFRILDILTALKDHSILPDLLQDVADPDPEFRKAVVRAMTAIGKTKWKNRIKGQPEDFVNLAKSGDAEALDGLLNAFKSLNRFKEEHIKAIFEWPVDDTWRPLADLLKENHEAVQDMIQAMPHGYRNPYLIPVLKEKILEISSKNRQAYAEAIEKLGDTSLKDIIKGDREDFVRLIMADFPGAFNVVSDKLESLGLADRKEAADILISVMGMDFTKVRNFNTLLDKFQTAHTDYETHSHTDVGSTSTMSDCHYDDNEVDGHTDKGFGLRFTPAQKVSLATFTLADLRKQLGSDDKVLQHCLATHDEPLLFQYLLKGGSMDKSLLADFIGEKFTDADEGIRELSRKIFLMHRDALYTMLPDIYTRYGVLPFTPEDLLDMPHDLSILFRRFALSEGSESNLKVVINFLVKQKSQDAKETLYCYLFSSQIGVRKLAAEALQNYNEKDWLKLYEADQLNPGELLKLNDGRLLRAYELWYACNPGQDRETCFKVFEKFGDEQTLQELSKTLGFIEDALKLRFYKMALKMGSLKTAGWCKPDLFSVNAKIRLAAAKTLSLAGFPEWETLIKGTKEDFVALAAVTDPEFISLMADSTSADICEAIYPAFGKSQNPVVYNVLLEKLRKEHGVDALLLKAIAGFGNRDIIPFLIKYLASDEPSLRDGAAKTMTALGETVWKELYKGDAGIHFQQLASTSKHDKYTIAVLMELMKNNSAVNRRLAAEALVRLASEHFDMLQENWKDIRDEILASPHADKNHHEDHWAASHSGDCHTDERSHTDTGYSIAIPGHLK